MRMAVPVRRALRTAAALLREAWLEYERDRARYLAVAMVYYAIVSLVPLLLLLLSALGLLLRFSAVAAETERQMLLGLEGRFGEELPAAINALLETLQEQSIVASAFSVVALLVTASVLFKHLRLSFRVIWKQEAPLVSGSVRSAVRATILERIIAFALVLGGGALLLAALVLIAAIRWLQPLLEKLPLLDAAAGWLLPEAGAFLIAGLTFAALFRFLPPVPVRRRHIWPAALLCALLWAAAGHLLTLYGAVAGARPSAYGAIGGLLAIMLWMNAVSQVLFFGAELCKVSAAHDTTHAPPRRSPASPETPAPVHSTKGQFTPRDGQWEGKRSKRGNRHETGSENGRPGSGD